MLREAVTRRSWQPLLRFGHEFTEFTMNVGFYKTPGHGVFYRGSGALCVRLTVLAHDKSGRQTRRSDAAAKPIESLLIVT